MEQSGSITLPTGEIIQRHPDAVVVVTTNTSYEVQQVAGPLYKSREVENRYGEQECDLYLFYDGIPAGLRFMRQKRIEDRDTPEYLLGLVQTGGLGSLSGYLDNLKQDMDNSRWIGLADIEFDLINELDNSIIDPDPKTRLRTVNLILVRCWEHIEDYCERLKAEMEANESMVDAVNKSLGGMSGATTAGTGGTPVPGAGSSGSSSATAPSRAKTHEDAAGANGDDSSEQETSEPEEENGDDKPAEEESAQSDEELPPIMGSAPNTGKQEVSESEGGRIPYHQTNSVSEPVGGSTEYNDDRYRLMDIHARSNNRDGAALRYVAERLSKRPEGVKLLILVSDGQPADIDYDGTAAEEDLRGIKQEYQRKGIVFVAAAIGDDKPSIQRIYGSSFLDITDLEQLPAKLTAVVKKHIRI